MNKVSYLPLVIMLAASMTTAYADEESAPENSGLNRQRVAYQENITTVEDNDPGKAETAASIMSILKGKHPSTAAIKAHKAEAAKSSIETQRAANREADETPNARIQQTVNRQADVIPQARIQQTASSETNAAPDVPAKPAPLAALPRMRRFQIIGQGQFAYNMDCFVKGEDILCKGSLKNQPESYKAYESTLIGKIAGATIKGTVSSYARIANEDDNGKCITSTENSWPMSITLSMNHEAIIEAGEVKSYVNSTGEKSCSGTNHQIYPGKTITMKWRMLG